MDAPDKTTQIPLPVPSHAESRTFLGQVVALVHVLRGGAQRRWLLAFALGLVGVLLLNAVAQVRLNVWQGTFYDALSRKASREFLGQLFLFGGIVAGLVVLGVSQTWLQELTKVNLREALTRDLLDQWLKPKRAYRLAFLGEIGVNPDQRLQEDARHLTELTADLAIGLFQASVLLVSFVGVLWLLSDQVVFLIRGRSVVIPGYMVWCALIYAVAGSIVAWSVGRPLIRLNADRYAREADLRFALVRVSESAEGIALDGGEAAERQQLDATLDIVLTVMRRLANGLARLTWITSAYGYVAIVVPIVVASPGYFSGTLSFGSLMMVVGAFQQVQNSLRWFVDNFRGIADWRATFERVMSFRDALQALERFEATSVHIVIRNHESGGLGFKGLGVLLPDGQAELEETDVEIAPGEHVQIAGDPGAGKTTLFRALAGLSTCGIGTLRLPPRNTMMFLPQRPYLPLGPLRMVLSYPGPSREFTDEACRAALVRVGLTRLATRLDRSERWDRELTPSEQQALVFARVLMRAPLWVIMDGALDALDEDGRSHVMSIFDDTLKTTAVINIGTARKRDPFFTRTLHLRRDPDSVNLRMPPQRQAAAAELV